jgi:exodeoxyribonuclease VII large subunit
MRSIYTVSDLTQAIKDALEGEFADVWVEGEISNLKTAASGHCYFTLKDASAQLRAVLFRNSMRLLRIKPSDGLRVSARGRLTVYEQRGEYQIIIDHMEPAGFGALQLAFEQLKQRLAKEGLFDSARKRPIPALPQRIGLITSPSGAVIADMISILQRRFENIHLLLYPVRVQGEGSMEQIVQALQYFSLPAARQVRGEVDVIILARGGGSLEDLWSFNEEKVARAIVNSRIPVISAIGHETDFTIADFVADRRAPTPSAAAELVIESKVQLHRQIQALRQGLEKAAAYRVQTLWRAVENKAVARAFERVRALVRKRAQQVDDLERRLTRQDVRLRLHQGREQAADLAGRLQHVMRLRLEREQSRLALAAAQLHQLGPQAVLDRGYALVAGPDGRLVRDPAQVSPGDHLKVHVSKGRFGAEVSS